MYAKGEGVPQNHAEAVKWFRRAADQGNAEAQENRGGLASKMPPAQIAEAQRLAAQWKPGGL